MPNVYDAPVTGRPQHYYPEQFPNGTYKLRQSVATNDTTYGPGYVRTDATQPVTIYKMNSRTRQYEPSGTQIDTGYWVHGGGYTTTAPPYLDEPYYPTGHNDVNDRTLGCIRMQNQDFTQFASLSDLALQSGGTSLLTVGGKGK